MTRTRADLVPLLAIIVGAATGVLASSLVLWLPACEVLARTPVVQPRATAELQAHRDVPTTRNVRSAVGRPGPPIYIDGVRVWSLPPNLGPDDFESVEIVEGDEARLLYGPDAADGVLRISLR